MSMRVVENISVYVEVDGTVHISAGDVFYNGIDAAICTLGQLKQMVADIEALVVATAANPVDECHADTAWTVPPECHPL